MVVLAEIVFSRWEHEEVNRGLLNMFCQKNIPFGLAATREHIQNIKQIGRLDDISIDEYEIQTPPDMRSEKEEASEEYAKLIENIINYFQLGNKDILVIATGRCAAINGAYSLYCQKKIGCTVWFVLHSFDEAMEQMVRNQDSFHLISLLNRIGRCERFKYITLNPNTFQYLRGIVCDQILKDIVFFNHPVVGERLRMNAFQYRKIIVYGASAQIEFRKLLYKMSKGNSLKKGMFDVLCNVSIDDLDTKYLYPTEMTQIYYGINGFKRNEYIKKIESSDWILIPYGKNLYKTKMSGILCDAIRWGKPIVSIDCSIVNWYHSQYPIGIVANDMDQLAKEVVAISEGKYDKAYPCYSENLEILKGKMEDENQRILEAQLQEC